MALNAQSNLASTVVLSSQSYFLQTTAAQLLQRNFCFSKEHLRYPDWLLSNAKTFLTSNLTANCCVARFIMRRFTIYHGSAKKLLRNVFMKKSWHDTVVNVRRIWCRLWGSASWEFGEPCLDITWSHVFWVLVDIVLLRYGSHPKMWKPAMAKPTPENLQSAWKWVKRVSPNTLVHLKLSKREVERNQVIIKPFVVERYVWS